MDEISTNTESHEQFVRLLAKHERSIRAFIRAGVMSSSDVAEVMQEVSLIAWRKFSELENPEEGFAKWACVIARYEILKFRRSKARDRLVLSEEIVERINEEGVEESNLREAHLNNLEDCLNQLPDQRRSLVVNAYSPGFSIKDFAEKAGKSPDSLYQLLRRIRQELAKCLEGRVEAT